MTGSKSLCALQLLLAAAVLFAPAAAVAQGTAAVPSQGAPSPPSQGSHWWGGGGGGYLAGRANCSNCETDPPHGDGSAVLVQGGVRAGERLQVGGELYTTSRTINGGTFRDTHLLGIFQFRPFARAGFFLKGGYGMALVKDVIRVAPSADVTARTWGMGVMYGAGWIFEVTRHVSLSPTFATYVTTVGDVKGVQATAQNVVVNDWFAGVVVMFR